MSKEQKNIIAYYEGEFDIHNSKCLSSLVRYIKIQIVAILSLKPTLSLKTFGVENKIPVISNVDDIPGSAKKLMLTNLHNNKDTLPALLKFIKKCIKKEIHIYNGDHLFLKPMVSNEEQKYVHDLRKTHADQELFSGMLKNRANQLRILTVGMDCNIGKMTASLELEKCLVEEGFDAKFVATGQIGIMIKGVGIPLDRTIVDFTSGMMEKYLMKHTNQILIIEGQGSIFSPMYSGLTLAQVHGSVPQLMILCVDPTRKHPRYFSELELPNLQEAILQYEQSAALLIPNAKIMGISANTSSMGEKEAVNYIINMEELVNLPVTDTIRFGCNKFKSPIKDWISANCEDDVDKTSG